MLFENIYFCDFCYFIGHGDKFHAQDILDCYESCPVCANGSIGPVDEFFNVQIDNKFRFILTFVAPAILWVLHYTLGRYAKYKQDKKFQKMIDDYIEQEEENQIQETRKIYAKTQILLEEMYQAAENWKKDNT